ncbi:PorP/SprF family type IX secretion system membrane protein [uncultured Microscilla sp.]|uniref:PorP/SprF family type IX secretion system membrane protein n=1 Tax=uncultured Microscilla sp. TaxID=432653 RepID=UPI0026044E72|nr:PorP/SprF family type IX secretion system membrane protein [uncultured Microscilla sp.]
MQVFLLLGGIAVHTLRAQVAPVQNQVYFNPYVYNDAFLGQSEETRLFVGVKKQWLGVQNSPLVATLTFEKPLPSGLNIGVRLVNVSEGPINTLSKKLSASYQIETGLEAHLSFGMSLGLAFSSFNASLLDDPNDPAIAAQNQSNFQFDGSLGIAYHWKNLAVGVAMPNFAAPQPFVNLNKNDEVTFSPWNYLIASLSLDYELDMDWTFSPMFIYHYQKDFAGQFEGGVRAQYQSKYYLGGLYRQNVGLTVLAGLDLSERFGLHYLYSFSSAAANLPNDSHELVLRVSFGKGKK